MKHFIYTLLLFSFIEGKSQTFAFDKIECGTYEPAKETISDWVTVDTMGTFKPSDKRIWVYDKEMEPIVTGHWQTLEYSPCGKAPWDRTWETYRICRITGIRQKKTRTQGWKYIEPPKTEYDCLVDSLYAVEAKLNEAKYKSILGSGISTFGQKGLPISIGSGLFYDASKGIITSVAPIDQPKKKKKRTKQGLPEKE
jgi:hypothetical protein